MQCQCTSANEQADFLGHTTSRQTHICGIDGRRLDVHKHLLPLQGLRQATGDQVQHICRWPTLCACHLLTSMRQIEMTESLC
jgi:hypothetical protein